MKAGTVLIVTNSQDATSDYLQQKLVSRGLAVLRYNTDTDLPTTEFLYSSVSGPIMSWGSCGLRAEDVGAVVFRRPKPFQPTPELDEFHGKHIVNEWAEVWEGFLAHIALDAWINHPTRNFAASHKIDQLSKARGYGLNTPETIVTNVTSKAVEFFKSHPRGVIVKPLASGYIERSRPEDDTVIYTSHLTEDQLPLLEKLRPCPVLIQERIDKRLDVRATILDKQMSVVALEANDDRGMQRLDIRRNNMKDVRYRSIEMPEMVKEAILALLRMYELRFAAVDFAVADDTWTFFEINPNGQWAWLDIEAGANVADMFADVLIAQQVRRSSDN